MKEGFARKSFMGAFREALDEIGPLSAGEVGELYEFLRGFSLSAVNGAPSLVPNPLGKRNQGLFYTPQRIVAHIVCGTLDALGPLTLPQLLTLKVLDPAMGTGIFLAEVLGQLTSRILAAGARDAGQLSECLAEISERLREEAPGLGSCGSMDEETLVRCHVLRHCLYGVDLDPIAVGIARSLLVRNALAKTRDRREPHRTVPSALVGASATVGGTNTDRQRSTCEWRKARAMIGRGSQPHGLGCQPPCDPAPNLRVGNSLVGERFRHDSRYGTSRADADFVHARMYLGPKADPSSFPEWVDKKRPFHWPIEFPEVWSRAVPGFDAVVGNPPYEILSERESGIQERRCDQAYFRKTMSTCHGKINTYRLMLERGLELFRDRGALGYIVPATLLADSTAEKLRSRLLESSRVREITIIPEKAKVFPGVTQAFLILITVKGSGTDAITPAFWNGSGPIPEDEGIEITRDLLVEPGMRVPLVRSAEEKALLKALMGDAPLGGHHGSPAVARVNQGEVNLTVHRRFVTAKPTGLPLIRGEHVTPFRVIHPSPRGGRLDWVERDFLGASPRPGTPWKTERIVVGRVVNMDTKRRLKAAPAAQGSLLGDMTNSLTEISVPMHYLLGLLNSSLLNWRLRLTSTNNYISAAEIQALPIPRVRGDRAPAKLPEKLELLLSDTELGPAQFLKTAGEVLKPFDPDTKVRWLGLMVRRLAEEIVQADSLMVQGSLSTPGRKFGHAFFGLSHCSDRPPCRQARRPPQLGHEAPGEPEPYLRKGALTRLDAVVALLYGVEAYTKVFRGTW
ncbi:MAG: Eco57I restriction-modification methylase domain-containing protein [Thermodesulfobacteriota bacterium]